uniref:Envelope glycoprotein Q2 n=1 Tax=Human betaherpesvirus 6A TaxID=32603 RepID=A0A8E4PMN6_9BETA|nr:envelope glycoprotein Q2 [Human betaherpesvirus 6A]
MHFLVVYILIHFHAYRAMAALPLFSTLPKITSCCDGYVVLNSSTSTFSFISTCLDGEILFQNEGQKFCRPLTDNRTIVYTMQDQVQKPLSVTWMDFNLVISDYGRDVINNLTKSAMLARKNGPRYLQMETFISDLFRHECHQNNYYVLDKKLQMFYPTTHSNELLFYPSEATLPSPWKEPPFSSPWPEPTFPSRWYWLLLNYTNY